ncbi:MAG: DUF560 domain-containing protein [Pseudomonadales bacterium]|nr:DUF560 domain-containing protein [Pseudomonadales bacterium]
MNVKHCLFSLILMFSGLCQGALSLDATLQKAIAARKQANFSAAIAVLKPMVEKNRQWYQGHLELAVNYYKLQQFDHAEEHISVVLTDPSLTLKSRQIAESLQSIIHSPSHAQTDVKTAARSPHQFSANGSVGVGHDNNANIGPDDAELDIGGRFIVPEALKTSDDYRLLTLSGGYSYKKRRPLIFFDKAVGLQWHSRVSAYDKNFDRLSRYDLGYVVVNTGPQFYQTRRWQLYLPLQYLSIDYGNEKLVDYFEFNPVYSLLFAQHKISVRGGITDKQYANTIEQIRKDGQRYRLGVEYRYKLHSQTALKTGLDFTNNQAKAKSRAYESLKLSVRMDHDFSHLFSAYSALSYEDFKYQAANEIFPDAAREETMFKAAVGLSATYKYFVSNLLWRYDDKSANHALYIYDRQRIELNIGFKY